MFLSFPNAFATFNSTRCQIDPRHLHVSCNVSASLKLKGYVSKVRRQEREEAKRNGGLPPLPVLLPLGLDIVQRIDCPPDMRIANDLIMADEPSGGHMAKDWYVEEEAYGVDGLRGFDTDAGREWYAHRGYDATGAAQAKFNTACELAFQIADHAMQDDDLEGPGHNHTTPGIGFGVPGAGTAGAGGPPIYALPPSTTANGNFNSNIPSAGTVAGGSHINLPNQVPAVSTGPHHYHHQYGQYHHRHPDSHVTPIPMAAPLVGTGLRGDAPSPSAKEIQQDKELAEFLRNGSDDEDDDDEEEEDYHSAKEAAAETRAGSKVEREERAVDTADGRRVSISPPEYLKEQDQGEQEDMEEVESSDEESSEDDESEDEDAADSSTRTPAKSTDKDINELPDNSRSPIQQKDPWPSVWPKLKASGWSYKPPSGLELDWTYIRPGKTVENGIEGVDFFRGENKMKVYIRDKHGWSGAVGDLDGVDAAEAVGRAGRKGRGQRDLGTPYTTQKPAKKTKKGPSAASKSTSKKSAKTPKSKKNKLPKHVTITPSARIDPNAPEILDTPIEATDEWLIVWDKLKRSGWRYKKPSGLDTDWKYFAPGKSKVKNPVEGEDYFKGEEAVRAFCKTAYGWDPKGAKKVRLLKQAQEEEEQAKLEAEKIAEKARKEKEAAAEKKRLEKAAELEVKRAAAAAAEKKAAAAAAAEAKRVAAEKKKLEKEAAAEAKRKAAEERRLAKEEAAAKKKAAASPDRVWGKEAHVEESPATPTHRTKPRDPAKPRLTDSPDTGRSLTPDDKDFYEWRNLWPRLKQAGWTYQRGNGLVSWLYVRPDRNPASDDTKLGTDYFQSEDDVIQYCRQADIQEGEVRRAKGTKGGTKRKSSPAKADRPSAITGDFDVEASSSPKRTTKKRKAEPMWWRTHPIPASRQVWTILKNKLGFKHGGGLYRHPDAPKRSPQMNVDVFPDAQNLREYLCKTGIPNFESSDLTDEERTLVKRWVATAYTPKGLDSNPEESVEVLRDVTVFTDNQAWALLTGKIGWELVDDAVTGECRYYKPKDQRKADKEASHGEDYFSSISEVQDYLRANGPFEARYNYKWTHLKTPNKGRDREIPCDVGPQEYLALTFWAARAPLPQHPSDVVDEEQEPTTEGTERTPNSSPTSPVTSPDSPFGAYQCGHDSNGSEVERPGGLLSRFNAAAGAFGSAVSHAFGHAASSPSRSTPNSTPTKQRRSPYQDMVDEMPPATPDEKLRQDLIVVDSQRKLHALSNSPAQAGDSWAVFWGKMQQAGWKLSSEDSRLKEVYIPPTGKQIKNGGEKGIDYFTSEDEVKQFAIDHLGWEGHDDGMEVDDDVGQDIIMAAATPAPDRQQMLILEAKNRMARINGFPVQHGDNWLNVKEKMKHTGWKWNIPAPRINGIPIGGDDFVWLLPTARKPKDGGKLGIDFLKDEMAARQFAVDHFNWCGEFKGIDEESSPEKPQSSGKASRRRG